MGTYYWVGGTGDWDDAGYWLGSSTGTTGAGVGGIEAGGPPTATDTAVFSNSLTSVVNGDAYIGNILLQGADVTLAGNFQAPTGEGLISDTSTGSGSASQSNAFTIGAWATVVAQGLQLDDTSLYVDGALIVGGGNANNVIVEGYEAALTIANTLTVGTLSVLQGALFEGNADIANGGTLTVDDQSSLYGGTVTSAAPATLDFESTVSGSSEQVEFSDSIVLSDPSTLTVTSDPGILASLDGSISGSGTLATVNDDVAIDGILTASGGSLTVGSVVGTGTLEIASGSSLILSGEAGAGLTISFGTNSTLTVTSTVPEASIANFNLEDTIVLPTLDVTATSYTQTTPDSGQLVLIEADGATDTLTLLGNESDITFSVAALGSGSVIQAAPSTIGIVGNEPSSASYGTTTNADGLLAAIGKVGATIQGDVRQLIGGEPTYVWYEAGDTDIVGSPLYSDGTNSNIQLLGPLTSSTPAISPNSNVILAPGYDALIAEGDEPIHLFDKTNGDALLVGNSAADTLVTSCSGDTLVGGNGANTVFWAGQGVGSTSSDSVTVQGGGNDTISTTNDNASIITSVGKSGVFLGASDNTVFSNGKDIIACGSSSIAGAQDTVIGQAGSLDTVFGPQFGSLIYQGQSNTGTVVGTGASIMMDAGSADHNELWAGPSAADYVGGIGSGTVVGGTQLLKVVGGSGALTVWGGSGGASIQGAQSDSDYIIGQGPSTVEAAIGNGVWVTGSAAVSVVGASGVDVYAGLSSGDDVFQASTGSETLWGSNGHNTFIVGSGSGTFVCNGSGNIISITSGLAGGVDEIVGFVPGRDQIDLHNFGSDTPVSVVHSGSTLVYLSDGTQLQFYGITNLSSSSFTSS